MSIFYEFLEDSPLGKTTAGLYTSTETFVKAFAN